MSIRYLEKQSIIIQYYSFGRFLKPESIAYAFIHHADIFTLKFSLLDNVYTFNRRVSWKQEPVTSFKLTPFVIFEEYRILLWLYNTIAYLKSLDLISDKVWIVASHFNWSNGPFIEIWWVQSINSLNQSILL